MLKSMEIVNLIGMLIAFILMMVGVICIYDARKLAKKYFSFHDQNEGAKWFKIGGFFVSMMGIISLYFTIS